MFASVFPYILLLKAGELARQAGGARDVDGQAPYRLLTKLAIEFADLDQAAKQKLTEALA